MTNQNGEYDLSASAEDMNLDGVECLVSDKCFATWRELEKLEHDRRELLQRAELPFWQILTYWSGTCLRALALDWMIWIPISIFCFIRFRSHSGADVPAMLEKMGDTDINVLGGFLSFLLVIFVNQTNSRFFEMYQLAKKCSGKVQDVAGLASTQLPSAAAHRLVRYMNSALVAGYVGLGGPYSKRLFFDHFNRKHKLLDDHEMKRVEELDMDSGSAAFKELVTWCQRDVGSARKAGHIDSYEAEQLHTYILDFRAAMDGIYDYCDQPTHFFYIHFLCLLSAFYLPLFAVENAYSAGWGDESDWGIELLNGLVVFLQAIFVVGLRLLGQIMIDPFGDDLEDLSVITYVSTTIENSRIIVKTLHQPDVDEALEKLLSRQNESNGLSYATFTTP